MVLSTTKFDARTPNGEFITSTDLAVEDRDRTFFLFSSIFPVLEKFPKREIFPIQYDFSLFDLVFPTDNAFSFPEVRLTYLRTFWLDCTGLTLNDAGIGVGRLGGTSPCAPFSLCTPFARVSLCLCCHIALVRRHLCPIALIPLCPCACSCSRFALVVGTPLLALSPLWPCFLFALVSSLPLHPFSLVSLCLLSMCAFALMPL